LNVLVSVAAIPRSYHRVWRAGAPLSWVVPGV